MRNLFSSEMKYETRGTFKKKMIQLTYWYIDYKQFVDVVKYKLYKMRQTVEASLKKV
jgi:transcription initiation factor IIE alpha subunit